MSIIVMFLVGLIVGVIAKMLMPGKDPGGFIVTALIGIAGSVLAGYLGRAMGMYREGDPAGLIASILGAVLLLAIYRMATGQRRVA